MDKRKLKMQFHKSGNGYFTPRISLPKKWIDKLEISLEKNDVEVFYDEQKKQIIIKKLD